MRKRTLTSDQKAGETGLRELCGVCELRFRKAGASGESTSDLWRTITDLSTRQEWKGR